MNGEHSNAPAPLATDQHTPGPWRADACGGYSTVLSPTQPGRNDTRIPAYAYNEKYGHCVGYPFLEDDGRTRLDFVCFSHADARLIAAAPELLEALRKIISDGDYTAPEEMKRVARAAIAKATGEHS